MAHRRAKLQSFLVECYWPGLTQALAETSTSRAREAAAVLTAQGTQVSYRSAFIVPEDEFAFCLFNARSAGAVVEACRLAELPIDRIVTVIQVGRGRGG